jgi:pimeloyl-ACP methyl ester carboxylesterase
MKKLHLPALISALVLSGITGLQRSEAQGSSIAPPATQDSALPIQTVAVPHPVKPTATKKNKKLRDTDALRTPLVLVKSYNESVARDEGFGDHEVVSVEPGKTDEPSTFIRHDLKTGSTQIVCDSQHAYERDRPTFVLTHGMGGSKTGDRFHQLADAICKAMPECNVLLIDWSILSSQTGLFGIPNPFAVAQSIDPVGREASELLKRWNIDPVRTTFIGESFGNYVNAQIAANLGGRGRILAFNPANAMGGYKVPNLRACSDVAWSFHTYSIFDTQDSIADLGIFLETSPLATEVDQHISGVSWLAERVSSGDLAWLQTTHNIAVHQAEYFDAIGTLSGAVLHQNLPRKRLAASEENTNSTQVMLAATSQGGIQD